MEQHLDTILSSTRAADLKVAACVLGMVKADSKLASGSPFEQGVLKRWQLTLPTVVGYTATAL